MPSFLEQMTVVHENSASTSTLSSAVTTYLPIKVRLNHAILTDDYENAKIYVDSIVAASGKVR